MVDYRDKRAWNRNAFLVVFQTAGGPVALTLAEDAEIECAAPEITEDQ